MLTAIFYAFWLALAFLAGSIPTGYLVVKKVRGLDIREHGSGNVGATNVFRVAGRGWGSAVLAIDMFKGWLASFVLAPASHAFPELSPSLVQIFFGAAAIAGHTWTPWLGFKGGKGIATSAGTLLGIFPLATVLALSIWTVCFLSSGYVSLSSIIAALGFPVLLLLFYRNIEGFGAILVTSIVLVGLLVFNHRSNLSRILSGTESRVRFGKKKD